MLCIYFNIIKCNITPSENKRGFQQELMSKGGTAEQNIYCIHINHGKCCEIYDTVAGIVLKFVIVRLWQAYLLL